MNTVIPFLRKRAERARARYIGLYSSERTEAETQAYIFALMDYAYEPWPKDASGKRRRRTKKRTAETLSRVEEICGPPTPLPPEVEELLKYMHRDPKGFLEWAEQRKGSTS